MFHAQFNANKNVTLTISNNETLASTFSMAKEEGRASRH